MTRKRPSYMEWFRAHVALEALRGQGTIREIAARHQLSPSQVSRWKRQALNGLPDLFAGGRRSRGKAGIRLLSGCRGRTMPAANDNPQHPAAGARRDCKEKR